MRVAFSNNYSPIKAWDLCAAGQYPRQHLYGADALARAGFAVRLVEMPSSGRLLELSSRFGWRLGHLAMLPQAFGRRDQGEINIAAEPYHAALLAQLRSKRWRKNPLVAVVHTPMRPTAFSRSLARGIDVAVCLSRVVQRQLVEDYGRDIRYTPLVPWGPDLHFGGYRSTGDDFVLSAGKTERDVTLLSRSLAGTGVPARIHGLSGSNGSVVGATPAGAPQLAYDELLGDLQRAAVIAIPLRETDRLIGLTELADGLALGKPIVMTRTPFIDVDIEAVGCGIWVEPGDEIGWRNALTTLWADSSLRTSMGAAGRRYAAASWNTDLFGQGMVAAAQLARELR